MARKAEVEKAEPKTSDVKAHSEENWSEFLLNIVNNNLVSKGVGKLLGTIDVQFGLYMKPVHEARMLKAKAMAPLYKKEVEYKLEDLEAEQEIKRLDREQCIQRRVLERESRRQDNLERVAIEAARLVSDEVEGEAVDEDWVARFVEFCQDVGDEEMQSLWARILAGEVARPGKYSTRTLHCVRTLSKEEACLFTRFCSCLWHVNTSDAVVTPVIPDVNAFASMAGIEIGLRELQELDAIGLIRLDTLPNKIGFGFGPLDANASSTAYCLEFSHYGERFMFIQKSKESVGKQYVNVGNVSLTSIGKQLAPISRAQADVRVREACLHFLGRDGWELQVK